MALIPKTSIQLISSSEMRIWDVTGDYSGLNTNGWGTSNLEKADVTIATISITSDSYTVPIVIDLMTLILPSTNYTDSDMFDPSGLQLLSTTVLGTTKFSDGMYTFVYTVSDGTLTYNWTNYQGFFIDKECCVRKKALNTTFPIINKEEVIIGALMNYLLDALYWSACCGNKEAHANINDYLTQLCVGCESTDMNNSVHLPCGCS